jgi:hypothetical protein
MGCLHCRYIYLGLYDSEIAAAQAYDLAVLKIRGFTNSNCNFPAQEYLDDEGQLPADDHLDHVINQLKRAAAQQLLQEFVTNDLALQTNTTCPPAEVVALIRQRAGLRRFAGLEQQLLLTLNHGESDAQVAFAAPADGTSCEVAIGGGPAAAMELSQDPVSQLSSTTLQLHACQSNWQNSTADEHARWQQQQQQEEEEAAAAAVSLLPATLAAPPESLHHPQAGFPNVIDQCCLQAEAGPTQPTAQAVLKGWRPAELDQATAEPLSPSSQDWLEGLDPLPSNGLISSSGRADHLTPAVTAAPPASDALWEALLLSSPSASTMGQSFAAADGINLSLPTPRLPVALHDPPQLVRQASSAGPTAVRSTAPVGCTEERAPPAVPSHNIWQAEHGKQHELAAASQHWSEAALDISQQLEMGVGVATSAVLTCVNINWLQRALPPHCQLQTVFSWRPGSAAAGMVYHQQSPAVPSGVLWGAAAWDGNIFHHSQLCGDCQQATDQCRSLLQQFAQGN